MTKLRLLLVLYISTIIGLFLYSYTQVDLSLTLSRLSLWQVVEKSFQYVGYFQRPLSTAFYVLLLILLFGTYGGLLTSIREKLLNRKTVWLLILFTGAVLTIAYNAFSYDLFNYIFDARIITYYHSNPYHHYALQYPHDPMLSFMHWVQRTYPYGPLWLAITVPFSFLGGQIFLITFYLFKLVASLSFLGTAYFVEKIAKKISPTHSLFALAIFSFSPLVIIEGLVSAHNDIFMIFLSTVGLYLLINKEYVTSLLSLIASVAVKFATAIWLPLWGGIAYLSLRKKTISYDIPMILGVVLGILPVVLATVRTNFQPWYFLYIFPFAALTRKSYVYVPVAIFSFFALLEYIPFLYTGNWNPPIPTLLNQISFAGIIVSLLVMIILFFYTNAVGKKRVG